MKFLIILDTHETNWAEVLKLTIHKAGGDATIVDQVENAYLLLSNPEARFDHIICGTMSGEWRRIMSEAKSRGIDSRHLLTRSNRELIREAKTEGVFVMEKTEFDNMKFTEQFFPTGGLKERGK